MVKEKQSKGRWDSGFTLIELIIVIAIMAVLVGVLAGQYIRYIKKARAAVCMSDCATLIQECNIDYIDENPTDESTAMPKILKTIAESHGADYVKQNVLLYDVTGICKEGGTYEVAIDQTTHMITSITCTKHGTAGGATKLTTANSDLGTLGIWKSASKRYNELYNETQALENNIITHTLTVDQIKEYFPKVDTSIVKAAYIVNEKGTKTIYWTDQDVSTVSGDTQVRAIRYNPNKGTYTAVYVKVRNCNLDPTVANSKSSPTTQYVEIKNQTSTTKASYESTLAVFLSESGSRTSSTNP